MAQRDKALAFADMHQPGSPLILYNIWDAGSAKTLADAGALAVASGSWSVAAAQGYGDGQKIPLDLLLQLVARMTAAVEIPVSIDFEGAYAVEPDAVAANVLRLIQAGATGMNFEDQIVGEAGLHSTAAQCDRIAAAAAVAEAEDLAFFVNARTDLFLKQKDASQHAALLPSAIERGLAYQEAGASGFFVPGLMNPDLIAQICQAVDLPINVMFKAGMAPVADLAACGVARISHGPGPYSAVMADLTARFAAL
ncbi:MAG: 2-methylisocitrate lyase-like PEP mutase family enzyme [Paracoccaceae bacterium]|jgi:2-methylisocitrate lyase-like PEP mutase family enzyme